MRKLITQLFIVNSLVSLLAVSALAASNLEGFWFSEKTGVETRFTEFNGGLTTHNRAYYANGAPSDYFFEFRVLMSRDVKPGEVFEGRMRSVDGYYGCVFDEPAQIQMTTEGKLKMNFPLLTFHRRTRSVLEQEGTFYQRQVDWTRWGFVETIYHFPIERWRVVSSECIIDQRNWTTSTLTR